MTKRQQFVLDQVKYSQGFFTVSFLSSTQTCTLPKNIFPITPQALCYSLPSSSCSQRHSTAGRKGARGEREHIALNLLSVRDQKQNGRALKAGSGLNYWPSLRLQTSLCLTYPLWTKKVPQKLGPVKKKNKKTGLAGLGNERLNIRIFEKDKYMLSCHWKYIQNQCKLFTRHV